MVSTLQVKMSKAVQVYNFDCSRGFSQPLILILTSGKPATSLYAV